MRRVSSGSAQLQKNSSHYLGKMIVRKINRNAFFIYLSATEIYLPESLPLPVVVTTASAPRKCCASAQAARSCCCAASTAVDACRARSTKIIKRSGRLLERVGRYYVPFRWTTTTTGALHAWQRSSQLPERPAHAPGRSQSASTACQLLLLSTLLARGGRGVFCLRALCVHGGLSYLEVPLLLCRSS